MHITRKTTRIAAILAFLCAAISTAMFFHPTVSTGAIVIGTASNFEVGFSDGTSVVIHDANDSYWFDEAAQYTSAAQLMNTIAAAGAEHGVVTQTSTSVSCANGVSAYLNTPNAPAPPPPPPPAPATPPATPPRSSSQSCVPNGSCSNHCGFGTDNCGKTCNDQSGCPSPRQAPPSRPASCSISFDQNPISAGRSTSIHWSSTGAVDFFINSIGYVSGSGSAAIAPSATSNYSGYVIDGRGGRASCQATLVISSGQCPAGYVRQGGECVFAECPSGYVRQGNQCVLAQSCSTPPSCQGDNLVNSCTGDSTVCEWGCAAAACNAVPSPDASLTAVPSLVHSGETTVVSWTSQNVDSCTVSGNNGNSWVGVSSSGETSNPIISQTTFTLHCDGYPGSVPSSVDKTAVVNIVPTFIEK